MSEKMQQWRIIHDEVICTRWVKPNRDKTQRRWLKFAMLSIEISSIGLCQPKSQSTTVRQKSFREVLHDLQKDFSCGKRRNTKVLKNSFISGGNIITMYRFGASSNKSILEIPCLFLKCNKNIIIRNTAYFDNLQKFSDCLICKISTMGIFSYKIEDIFLSN